MGEGWDLGEEGREGEGGREGEKWAVKGTVSVEGGDQCDLWEQRGLGVQELDVKGVGGRLGVKELGEKMWALLWFGDV